MVGTAALKAVSVAVAIVAVFTSGKGASAAVRTAAGLETMDVRAASLEASTEAVVKAMAERPVSVVALGISAGTEMLNAMPVAAIAGAAMVAAATIKEGAMVAAAETKAIGMAAMASKAVGTAAMEPEVVVVAAAARAG